MHEVTEAARRALERDWAFRPSRASRYYRRLRIEDVLTRLRPAPPVRVIRAAEGRGDWTLFFLFAPDGSLTVAQRFTLARLAALPRRLLVVCATPAPGVLPEGLDAADALLWKGLSGYDFSAYAAGLRHLAARASGSDVFVLNDSVLGPFADLAPLLARARWDLTGLTASALHENHVQSYAFLVKRVTRARLWALRSVFMPGLAVEGFDAVVRLQETRLARIAARSMTVGALWHPTDPTNDDPTRHSALPLLEEGFPFVKRSLFGKYRHVTPEGDVRALEERLAGFGLAGV